MQRPHAAAPAPMEPKKPAAKPGAGAKKPAAAAPGPAAAAKPAAKPAVGAPGPAVSGRHLLATYARERLTECLALSASVVFMHTLLLCGCCKA